MAIDLFSYPAIRQSKLHANFVQLKDDLAHGPARSVLHELQRRFNDPDGNFVEQFQTTGFDARTFELFLFQLFDEKGHQIDRSFDRPDFLLTKEGFSAAIEAVTSNGPDGNRAPYSPFSPKRNENELIHHLRNEFAVLIGSPLYSKLKKKYWDLPQVSGKPLVLALECFHEPGSLSHTAAPVQEYLYGTRHDWYHDDSGNLVIEPRTITTHHGIRKPIPSGFFNQPGSENISAVLFCNTGTIAKFNRMGHQNKATRSRYVRMFRAGAKYRIDPNASMPDPFIYEVGGRERVETWEEGTVLIHNPKAAHPVPLGWLGAAVESTLSSDGQVLTTYYDDGFTPYWSETYLFSLKHSRRQIDVAIQRLWETLQASPKKI